VPTSPPANFAEHTLVTFGGTLGYGAATTTQDRWMCGVRVSNDINGAPVGAKTDPAGYAALVGPALKAALLAGSGTYASLASDCSVDFIKVAQIGTDGKYLAGSGSPYLYTAGLPAPGGTGRIGPPMQALKITLTTANPRGRGHIGGFYLPFVGYTGWNTSTLTAAVANDYRDWGKKILAAIKQTTTSDNQPAMIVIASRLSGTLTKVTGVKVGTVVDVQQRRKEQVVETYTTPVPFP
jgi:hypothetical protein